MKCKVCGGTGTSNTCVNGTFKPCSYCDGTGEYEPFDADIELDKLDEVLGEFPMPEAKLVSITPNYKELLLLACSKPYGKEVKLGGLKHIIEAGHLSVLEHCYASFEVKCSVRVLGQLTRHRHLSFTCQSARGKEFDTFVEPSLAKPVDLSMHTVGDVYRHKVWAGAPFEEAAYYLPQGIQTNIVVTGNFRAWFEYLPKRMCKRAMPEHRQLALMIHEILKKEAPEVFELCRMNCENCKERSCEFH